MALEDVVFQRDLFNYGNEDMYNFLGGDWSYECGVMEKEETENNRYANWNISSPSMVPHLEQWGPNSSLGPDIENTIYPEDFQELDTSTTMSDRPRRRRSKSKKKQEDIENQRMTHIAVERNRRKLMNEYLSELRTLMPDSYVLKSDQASIIGGAINYVKELEQQLQFLGGHKHINQKTDAGSSSPFAEFFNFPQYSTSLTNTASDENHSSIADIEVTMVENHASLKISTKRRPKQLLKMVSSLQSLRLTILHLNVTTVDQIVIYSLNVKVEDDCKLTSVDKISTAAYQTLNKIREELIFV
ncbi:unnamed protein product [Ilex paraguariensis]|uniref:BHLH domain-containing protein n=1 Tax=Ilex paraguariensis TaxID=185542 RepID=A0ABC8QV46_9AQUA